MKRQVITKLRKYFTWYRIEGDKAIITRHGIASIGEPSTIERRISLNLATKVYL